MLFILALVIVVLYSAVLGVILWKQRTHYPFSLNDSLAYLFFARYPLLSAIVAIFMAPLALSPFRDLLSNFFVMSSIVDIGLTTLFAILVAWAFMYTLLLMLRTIPDFFGVRSINQPDWLPAWALKNYAWFFALAALPTVSAVVIYSTDLKLYQRLIGIGAGIVLAWAINQGWTYLHPRLDKLLYPAKTQLVQYRLVRTLPNALEQGYSANQGHFLAGGFLSLTLLIYLFCFLLFNPTNTWVRIQPPAIVYLFLLVMLIGWLLPALSLFLDRFRVPTFLILVLVSFLSWSLGKTDFYYELLPQATNRTSQSSAPFTPEKALEAWTNTHPVSQYPVMVVVTASGGGITSALWTTHVLTTLQEQLGDRFSQSIVLISSVSGGSVGTMYYADAYTKDGAPSPTARQQILKAAGSPSLAAASWGLVYPDLWRLFFAVPLWNKLHDRGWALEQTWARNLADLHVTLGDSSNQPVTLDRWRNDIAAGWRPPVIFNATIVETGEAFWFTPLDLPAPTTDERGDWQIRSFTNLYPNHDVRVVTAARLSATFPYVTPIARPMDSALITQTYHLADGGYYDNHGVISAVEWLDRIAKNAPQLFRKKIIFLQIEDGAFTQDALADPNNKAGWLYGLAGPLVTMLNTRGTAQHLRSNEEVKLLSKVYPTLEITPVIFAYGGHGPLSWQLSQTEKNDIQDGLDRPKCEANLQRALRSSPLPIAKANLLNNYCQQNEEALNRVKAIFASTH